MNIKEKGKELKALCFGKVVFPEQVLNWVEKENLWNLWVPKAYGGLECSFSEGLHKLKELAKTDGSLGWTVTLCSGANYFIGNLPKKTAEDIFINPDSPVCMGGSGGVFGTAEKQGDHYLLSGKWRYATGAPYLTHFTLNAEIHENGVQLQNPDGSPQVRSFVVPKHLVQLIEDWNTMGLKATATHSFKIEEGRVHKRFSFLYNEVHLPQAIFKIPFRIFADLTLWANYIGMAEHFMEMAQEIIEPEKLTELKDLCTVSLQQLFRYAEEIESRTPGTIVNDLAAIHREASFSVRKLTHGIISVYPLLGIKVSREDHALNQVFRDYFTATQHYIFRCFEERPSSVKNHCS